MSIRRRTTSEVARPSRLRPKQLRGRLQCTEGFQFRVRLSWTYFRQPPANRLVSFAPTCWHARLRKEEGSQSLGVRSQASSGDGDVGPRAFSTITILLKAFQVSSECSSLDLAYEGFSFGSTVVCGHKLPTGLSLLPSQCLESGIEASRPQSLHNSNHADMVVGKIIHPTFTKKSGHAYERIIFLLLRT